MNPSVLRITVRRGNVALVDFLAENLKLSKKKAKALLDSRAVLVNAERVWMARHPLRRGDRLEVVLPVDGGRTAVPPPPTLFENNDYLVIDKPPKMLSNGPDSVEQLLHSLLRNPHLRVAHRLDRDTSGCLLAAKTPQAFGAAVELFKKRGVRKLYHAIVHGRLSSPDRNITFPLEGRSAVTRFRTLDDSPEASHLLIEIETGRTHQIRKHLAALGHPVLGDREHGLRVATSERSRLLPRHMLHASDLRFISPVDGCPVRANSPLPTDFRKCLREMRLK